MLTRFKFQTMSRFYDGSIQWPIEYAKTSWARCKHCDEIIEKGTLRMGANFFMSSQWFHLECFSKSTKTSRIRPKIQSELPGLEHLFEADKNVVRSIFWPNLPVNLSDIPKLRFFCLL